MKIEAKTFSDLDSSKSADGLIPAIIQDDRTLRVLMLGYMNREAYEKSLAEGRVTFYSRSRQCLWTKGETSGNYLDIVSVAADCDNDTLLIRVIPHGPTCHTGQHKLFRRLAVRERGFHTLSAKRHQTAPHGYARRLIHVQTFPARRQQDRPESRRRGRRDGHRSRGRQSQKR